MHGGQISEFVFLIWCRYLANGVCPVLSWDSMLASFLGSVVTRLMYLLEGVVGSVFFILSYHSDFCHPFCARCLSFLLCVHFIAGLLCGSVFLRNFGSLLVSLLPIIITFFTSSSVHLLPFIYLFIF